ncbi:MarR family transcriptional regulator [Iamia sp. SCSIO 61187]|nr:MarR family transcriptional regulator [Iamia sp. SCSIO 61187]
MCQDAGMVSEPARGFVERFGTLLEEAGIPRMPARVFATLVTSDEGALTAAELAEALGVSPAAISGAVRYLRQVDLLVRERERGSRRDRYVLHDEVWYEAAARRDQLLGRWVANMRDGAASFGPDTPTGARLVETGAFYQFLLEEMPEMLGRWREQKADRVAAFGRGVETTAS